VVVCKTCTSQSGVMQFCVLIDPERMITLDETVLVCENKKYECRARLKVKIHILFYRDNS
jgi:thymidine kinase